MAGVGSKATVDFLSLIVLRRFSSDAMSIHPPWESIGVLVASVYHRKGELSERQLHGRSVGPPRPPCFEGRQSARLSGGEDGYVRGQKREDRARN